MEKNLIIKNSLKNLSICLSEVANSNVKSSQFNQDILTTVLKDSINIQHQVIFIAHIHIY